MPITPEEQNKGYVSLQNEVVDPASSQVIRRYTNPPPVPTMPGTAPTGALSTPNVLTAPTVAPVDETAIREDTRKRMQTSVDAINAEFTNLIGRENIAGQDRAGQTRAMGARSGLAGSDFGAAQQEKTAQYNKGQVKALEDEKVAKVTAIQQNIEDRASAEIQAKKQEALGQYERDTAAFQQAQEQAKEDLKTLAASGTDLNSLAPAQKAALLKQAGYSDPAMGEVIYNALKPKASQIDYKFEKLADGQGMFYGTDPTTGELVTQKVSVPVPPGYTLTVAPDGTPLIFNKDTGQAQVAEGFGQGQFAKPVDPASEFLDNPKKQAAFNQIVGKYNISPLIQAADRTIVLKNTINAVKQDPSNGSKQLSLAYGYIQALDTYQSAVREGELGLVNSIDSKIGKFQNTIQQIQNGQIVRPEVIQEIADTAANLVDYISEGARNKEKVFESQARVNGIEDAWTEFRSGFSTSYDEPQVQLTPINGSDLKYYKSPLIQKYPYEETAKLLEKFPDATESEIQDALGLKAKGGISATSPIAPIAIKYPEGFNGGQCGDFAHKLVEFPRIGDSKSSKIAAVQKFGIPTSQWRNDVRVGDVIITGENPTYGHVAVVNEVLPNGEIRLSESNFKQSGKVSHDRMLSIKSSQIYGAIRGNLRINV